MQIDDLTYVARRANEEYLTAYVAESLPAYVAHLTLARMYFDKLMLAEDRSQRVRLVVNNVEVPPPRPSERRNKG